MKPRAALRAIASYLSLYDKELRQLYFEGGFISQDDSPPCATNGAEGRILYALVRALKPLRILEIGTGRGGSTSHMAEALVKNGNNGELITIDNNPDSGRDLDRHYVEMGWVKSVIADANTYIEHPGLSDFDFIFEDGAHSIHQIQVVYQEMLRILKPGGVVLSHDVLVEGIRDYYREAWEKARFTPGLIVQVDPSPCGLSIYRRPL